MFRNALLTAALSLPLAAIALPTIAGEWDGSLNFSVGGGTGAWSASIKDGRGHAYIAGEKVRVVRDGNKIQLSGDGISGSGKVKNGKVSGTFTRDGANGTFSGKRK